MLLTRWYATTVKESEFAMGVPIYILKKIEKRNG